VLLFQVNLQNSAPWSETYYDEGIAVMEQALDNVTAALKPILGYEATRVIHTYGIPLPLICLVFKCKSSLVYRILFRYESGDSVLTRARVVLVVHDQQRLRHLQRCSD